MAEEVKDTFRFGEFHSPSLKQQYQQLDRRQKVTPTFSEAWDLNWQSSEYESDIGDYLMELPYPFGFGKTKEEEKFEADYISPEQANTEYPTEEPFTENVKRGYAEVLHNRWRKKEEYDRAISQYDGNWVQRFATGAAGMTASDFVVGVGAEVALRLVPGLQFSPTSPLMTMMAREAAVAGLSGLVTGGARYFSQDEMQQHFSFTDVLLEGGMAAGMGAAGGALAFSLVKFNNHMKARNAVDVPAEQVMRDGPQYPLLDHVNNSNLLEYNQGLLPDIEMKRIAYYNYEIGFDGKARDIFVADPNTYYSSTGRTTAIPTDFQAARGTFYGTNGITVVTDRAAAEIMASSNYTTKGGVVTKFNMKPNIKLLDLNARLKDNVDLHNQLKTILKNVTDASDYEVSKALPQDHSFHNIMKNLDMIYSRNEAVAVKDSFIEFLKTRGYAGYDSPQYVTSASELVPKRFLFDTAAYTTHESADVGVRNSIQDVTKTIQEEFAEKYKVHLGEDNQLRMEFGDEVITRYDKLKVRTQEQYISDIETDLKRRIVINDSEVANIEKFMDYVSKERPVTAAEELKAKVKAGKPIRRETEAHMEVQMKMFNQEFDKLKKELMVLDEDIHARVAESLVFCVL